MQEGKFDDLPGKGKPLNLEEHPHQDPEWRVAHHLLKSGGFSLPWIEHLGEINKGIEQAQQSLSRSWVWQQREKSNTADWRLAIDLFKKRVQEINEQIRACNLEVPGPRFQVPLIDADQEIERIMQNGDF